MIRVVRAKGKAQYLHIPLGTISVPNENGPVTVYVTDLQHRYLIEFVKKIRELLGLGLLESKSIADRVLKGEKVALLRIDKERAGMIISSLAKVGAKAEPLHLGYAIKLSELPPDAEEIQFLVKEP